MKTPPIKKLRCAPGLILPTAGFKIVGAERAFTDKTPVPTYMNTEALRAVARGDLIDVEAPKKADEKKGKK